MADVTVVEETTPLVVVPSAEFFPAVVATPEPVYVLSTRLLIDYPPRFYGAYVSSGY